MLGNALLHDCGACGGTFVDARLLPRVTDPLDLGGEILAGGEPPRRAGGGAPERAYLPCPRCGELMRRRLFAEGAKVVIDECRAHGTWFDAAELRAVAAFAASGGMERAARREGEQAAAARRKAGLSAAAPERPTVLTVSDGNDSLLDVVLSFFEE